MASLTTAEIIHESRNSNVDAHRLAKRSIYESIGRHVWLLSPLMEFVPVIYINKDCTVPKIVVLL
jgi:hypothetical protein